MKVSAHDGIKSAKCCFLDNLGLDNYLLTTGFNKTAGRQVKLFDIRSPSSGPLQEISHESGSGFLLPYWVEHVGILLIVPKGESSIRIFSLEEGKLQRIEPFRAQSGQRSMGFLPPIALDPSQQEIVRAYKGEENGTTITPISFVVEKKDKSVFYNDLYPPCISSEAATVRLKHFSLCCYRTLQVS